MFFFNPGTKVDVDLWSSSVHLGCHENTRASHRWLVNALGTSWLHYRGLTCAYLSGWAGIVQTCQTVKQLVNPTSARPAKRARLYSMFKCWCCSLIEGHLGANVSVCQSDGLHALICHQKHPPISVSLHATVKVVRAVTLHMRKSQPKDKRAIQCFNILFQQCDQSRSKHLIEVVLKLSNSTHSCLRTVLKIVFLTHFKCLLLYRTDIKWLKIKRKTYLINVTHCKKTNKQ